MYRQVYRVVLYDPAGYPSTYQTLESAFSLDWGILCNTDNADPDFSFETATSEVLTWDSIMEDENAFDEIIMSVDDDKNNDHDKSKRQRRIGCSSIFCDKVKRNMIYWVNDTSYCGSCLDKDRLLALRFCSQHSMGKEVRWSVFEQPYNDRDAREQAQMSLQENEFWVHLQSSQPYNYGEFRFIGVGPRRRAARVE
jgi:hypothetical protein